MNNGGQRDPFETCYQLGDEATYCWSKSYNDIGSAKFNKCFPMSADRTISWHPIVAKWANPVTKPINSCGPTYSDMF